MRAKIIFAIVAIATYSISAQADQACAHPHSDYDKTYCTAKLFVESDTELNNTYQELSTHLTPAVKKSLITAQRAWIKFRDVKCSADETIDVDCNFAANKARTTELQDRLRECKTGHCDDKLIGNTSFNNA